MSKETRQIGEFVATDESGNEWTILVYQEFHATRTRTGTQWLEGQKYLETAEGDHVNRIEQGKYEIIDVETITVTSDDPEAP